MKKILENDMSRRIAAIILGIILSVAVSVVAITLGYTHVRTHALNDYTVELLGLPIFAIKRIGEEVAGAPNMSMMMFLGIIFSMVLALVAELIVARGKKRKDM